MKVSSDDDQPQSSIGIKRKQEIPKKASNRRALDLFYASVRDTTIWSDALAQWKQMPDDKKKPFTDQAAAELVIFKTFKIIKFFFHFRTNTTMTCKNWELSLKKS